LIAYRIETADFHDFRRTIMKWILVSAGLVAIASISPAEAKGCIKGAVVGGVAGHMAGHGKLGAAAGCAIGHHEANKSGSSAKTPEQPSGQK
jgi:outer membrane lipoprotein SlyB